MDHTTGLRSGCRFSSDARYPIFTLAMIARLLVERDCTVTHEVDESNRGPDGQPSVTGVAGASPLPGGGQSKGDAVCALHF